MSADLSFLPQPSTLQIHLRAPLSHLPLDWSSRQITSSIDSEELETLAVSTSSFFLSLFLLSSSFLPLGQDKPSAALREARLRSWSSSRTLLLGRDSTPCPELLLDEGRERIVACELTFSSPSCRSSRLEPPSELTLHPSLYSPSA